MPLKESQKIYINGSLEHLFYSLPENLNDLENVTKKLHQLLLAAMGKDPSEPLREQLADEAEEDFILYKAMVAPHLQLSFMDSIEERQFCEIQEYIFNYVRQQLIDYLSNSSLGQSPEAATLHDYLKKTFILPQIKNEKTKALCVKVARVPELPSIYSWEIPPDELKIFTTQLIPSYELYNSRIRAQLKFQCEINLPNKTLTIAIDNLLYYPASLSGTEYVKKEAINQAEIKSAKTVVIYLLHNGKNYQLNPFHPYQTIAKTAAIDSDHSSINLNFINLSRETLYPLSSGMRLLTYKYYFGAVMSGWLSINDFKYLELLEIRNLRNEAIIYLQQQNLLTFNQAKSIEPHILKILNISLYSNRLLNKTINSAQILNLTPEQSFILTMPTIQNLQSQIPEIPFYSIINITKNTVELISLEFYYNLLIRKKIAFYSLQRIQDHEVTLLRSEKIMTQLANLKYISSAILRFVLDSNYAYLLESDKFDLKTIENISDEEAQKLTENFISYLVVNEAITIQNVLDWPYESIKILSGYRLSYLIYQKICSVEQALLLTPQIANLYEESNAQETYLISNFFYRQENYLLSFIPLCNIFYNRMDALAKGKFYRLIENTSDSDKILVKDFTEFCANRGIPEDAAVAGIIKLHLSRIKNQILEEKYKCCLDILSFIYKAETTEQMKNSCADKDKAWVEAYDEVLHIARTVKISNHTLAFMMGGPTYNRLSFPANGNYKNRLFLPARISDLIKEIKQFATVMDLLKLPKLEHVQTRLCS